MSYRIVRLIGLLLGLPKYCVYKMLYGRALSWGALRMHRTASIWIRNGGKFVASNLKSRRGLKILCDGGVLSFGENCFVNNDCSFNVADSIVVGSNTYFGEGVKVYDHNHELSSDHRVLDSLARRPVKIGSHCWIGSGVIVLAGVEICDNVTVGAGTIVSKSIRDPGVYISKNPLHQMR